MIHVKQNSTVARQVVSTMLYMCSFYWAEITRALKALCAKQLVMHKLYFHIKTLTALTNTFYKNFKPSGRILSEIIFYAKHVNK